MYIVQDKEFDDLIDACKYCRENPLTTVVNDSGEILMLHEPLSEDEALDIRMIQIMLLLRGIKGNTCSHFSLSSSHGGFGSILSSLGCC